MKSLLSEDQLASLALWAKAHAETKEAEFIAKHPASRRLPKYEHRALVEETAKLRASADRHFRHLLMRNAFGKLKPMPE